MYFFYEALRRDNGVAKASFGLSFLATLLVKESSVRLAAFFLLFLGMERRLYHRDLSSFPLTLAIAAPPVAALVVYTGIAGGFERFGTLAAIILESPRTNVYAARFRTGPFFVSYVVDFFLLSPLTLLV